MTPPIVDYGLESGLNTQQIIAAELQPYEYPVTNLQNEQSTLNSNVSDYQQINSDLVTLETAASQLAASSGWNARSATSSAPTVVSATAQPGTPTGSVQFSVLQLAAANSLVSAGYASSTSQIVTSAPYFLVSQGGGQLGLASLASGGGLSLGSHTVSVTQASSAASTTGAVDLGSQASGITVTTGTNDTVDVTADGTAYQLQIGASPSGGYSGQGLLTAVQSAISAAGAGGVLQAGFDSGGHLVLSTVDQGSTQSLQVTGGDALSTLGLATTSVLTGTDAVVSVDGTTTTLSTVAAGSTVTLAGPAGSDISATVASPSSQAVNASLLSVGSITATNVSTGNGSLADVVNNINAAGLGVVASAVQTGTNQYVLQLASTTTGSNADLSVNTGAFAGSSLGSLQTASAGQDAEIQVGGAGGYTVSSQTNSFTGLLPGLTVTAEQVSATPITVTVGNDATTVAASVQSLVDDANTVLSDIQKYAGYNEQTKTGGPLMGSSVLQNLTNDILGIFASTTGTSTLGNAVNAGITLSGGQLSFDQTAFEQAFTANPDQVQAMFAQGGTFSPASGAYSGQVSLSYASNTTKAGSYQVQVTQSAAPAVDTGATLTSGTVSAGETLSIAMDGANASYTTAAGQSLASIASGLNAAFAAGGLQLSAQVVNGDQLKLQSDGYGSAVGFTVSSDSTAPGTLGLTGAGSTLTVTGTDVAGTINGQPATGNGQFLSAPASDPTLAGLSLQVTATGITGATNLGTFTYVPGIAQAVASLASAMSDPADGEITQTIDGLQNQSTGLTPQIQFYSNIVAEQQKLLMAQYANLESTLGSLKNQSSALSSQLAQMSTSGL